MRQRFWLTIVLAWAVCFFWSGNLGATRYTYRNLNTFYDYDAFRVTRINASGQVAGTHIYPDTPTHACFGSGTRPLQDLGTLYPDPNVCSSYGMGINKLATVVGYSGAFKDYSQSIRTRGFSWTAATGMSMLKALGDSMMLSSNDSYAYSINESGQIVGYSTIGGGGTRAVLWNPGSPIQDLQVFTGGNHSYAYDINKAGQVVGRSEALVEGSLVERAFLWTPEGGMQDLGIPEWFSLYVTYASGINDQGQVVGGGVDYLGNEQIVWWPSGPGSGQVLGWLGHRHFGISINNAGTVVGYFYGNYPINPRALVWTKHGLRDLNDLVDNLPEGTILQQALSINDRGQIVGTTNTGRSFLLTPVSVPLSPSLFLLLD